GMGRVWGAGAVLVVLVVLGVPLAAGEELSRVFHELSTSECHFINGTNAVRFVERSIYNRQQYTHFDSDVGVVVGDTPYGEEIAKIWKSHSNWLEEARAQANMFCRPSYKLSKPFLVNRR
ncbi:HB2J protein, partial [Neopipo cinnamomea]|nr:HB2J protein [Neopipo cinnamomea]